MQVIEKKERKNQLKQKTDLTFSVPTPRNSQTGSNNSSANCRQIV